MLSIGLLQCFLCFSACSASGFPMGCPRGCEKHRKAAVECSKEHHLSDKDSKGYECGF